MRRRPFLLHPLAWSAPAAARAAPRKVLRLALPSPETTLDPVQTQSDSNTNLVLSHILESPLMYDYLARPARLLPCTAEALPEVSADGRRFTIRIRRGIFFADDPAFGGRPRELVAADHVYAIKRFYDPRWNSADTYIFESLALPGLTELRRDAARPGARFDYDRDVEGLQLLDRYTFRITLGTPDPRFIYVLAQPVFTGAVAREVVEHYGDDIGAHPVGTGPFRLRAWRRGSRIELERSPRWRGMRYEGTPADDPTAREIAAQLAGRTLPQVDEVIFDVIEESQPRWLSFLQGRLAWLEVPGAFRMLAAPGGRIAPFLARRGIGLQQQLRPDMAMSFFFMEDPLVGGYAPEKVALRRAIGLAFDNRAYVQHVMGGFGLPAQSTLVPHTSGYDPRYVSEMSRHDPARAQALLDLHGYLDRDGDGWREQPDGSPLLLRMAGTATQRDRQAHEIWKRCLDAVGLRIRFEIASWPELLKRSRAGSLMMWGYQWGAQSPDGGFFLGIAYGPNASEANDPRFALAQFDRLFEQQRAMPDGAARDAAMARARDLLVAYMPFKVHAHPVRLDLTQPWLKGYWRHPFMVEHSRYVDLVDPAGADGATG